MDKKYIISALMLVMGASAASAATYDLSLTADEGSRWFEYFSDAYYELGKEPAPGIQGAWQISEYFENSNDVSFGGGDVAFPTADMADIGVITYSEVGLTGTGVESASITGLEIDFLPYMGYSSIQSGPSDLLGAGYTTAVDSISGSMKFVDGVLSGIDLSAAVTLTYLTEGAIGANTPHEGVFTIDGLDFSLLAGISSYDATAVGSPVWGWNVTGDVSGVYEVPVPAAAWLFGSALLGLAGAKRKKNS